MAKKAKSYDKRAVTSILMRLQFNSIEIAFDAFSQGHTAITMDFIHNELWQERCQTVIASILKDLEKHLTDVSAVVDRGDKIITTVSLDGEKELQS
jgi:hypothetical protein